MKINRTKRLFTLVMIVLIITGMTIPASLAANPNRSTTTTISNADELQTYFKNPAGKTAVLMNDITAPKGKAFVLPKGQNATLDLHGKTLTGADGIEVITIDGGNLRLIDSAGNAGKITHNQKEGRGIFIRSGSLVMEGGNVSQNYRLKGSDWNANGGGVYVKQGEFTMRGGIITQNAAVAGGGVYTENGNFTLKGGIIIHNSASHGGGVFAYWGDTIGGSNSLSIDGGQITGNIVSGRECGGGVYIFEGGLRAGNQGVIHDNYAVTAIEKNGDDWFTRLWEEGSRNGTLSLEKYYEEYEEEYYNILYDASFEESFGVKSKSGQKSGFNYEDLTLIPCNINSGNYMTKQAKWVTAGVALVIATSLLTWYFLPAGAAGGASGAMGGATGGGGGAATVKITSDVAAETLKNTVEGVAYLNEEYLILNGKQNAAPKESDYTQMINTAQKTGRSQNTQTMKEVKKELDWRFGDDILIPRSDAPAGNFYYQEDPSQQVFLIPEAMNVYFRMHPEIKNPWDTQPKNNTKKGEKNPYFRYSGVIKVPVKPTQAKPTQAK